MREVRKRANLIRHIRLVHKITDRDGKNASKISNKDTGVPSYDKVQTSNESYGQHSGKSEKGRSMSEAYRDPTYEISHLRMEGPQTEEKYEYEPRSISEMAKHLTEDDFQRLGEQLRSKKSSILNSVLEIIPENLKYRAKCICDQLLKNDSIFFNDKRQLIVGGEVIPNSNICTKIIEALTSCSNSGPSIQPTRNETKSTKMKTRVPRREMRGSESRKSKKSIAKSLKRLGITKFETLFDDDEDDSEEDVTADDKEYEDE